MKALCIALLLVLPASAENGNQGEATSGKGVCTPKIVKSPDVFPEALRLPKGAKYKNSPVVSVTVSPDGTPSNLKLKQSSGIKSVDDAVLSGLKYWKFKPLPERCGAVETQVSVDVHWQ